MYHEQHPWKRITRHAELPREQQIYMLFSGYMYSFLWRWTELSSGCSTNFQNIIVSQTSMSLATILNSLNVTKLHDAVGNIWWPSKHVCVLTRTGCNKFVTMKTNLNKAGKTPRYHISKKTRHCTRVRTQIPANAYSFTLCYLALHVNYLVLLDIEDGAWHTSSFKSSFTYDTI